MQTIFFFYKQNYQKRTRIIFLLGILIFICSYFYFLLQPNHAEFMFKEMIYATEQKGFDGENSQLNVFLLILWNNLKISFIMILLGLIPIFILPTFTSFATFFCLGLVVVVFETELSLGLELSLSLLPHVIVEFFGFAVAASIGISLSYNVFLKIFSKKRNQISLFAQTENSLKGFLFLVVPIIFLGSLIECTISPILTDWLLPFR